MLKLLDNNNFAYAVLLVKGAMEGGREYFVKKKKLKLTLCAYMWCLLQSVFLYSILHPHLVLIHSWLYLTGLKRRNCLAKKTKQFFTSLFFPVAIKCTFLSLIRVTH